MYGKPGSVALTFIKSHTRTRKPDTQADASDPNPSNGNGNGAALEGMSDDNKALFNSLAQYITMHVEQNIQIQMQSLNERLDILSSHVVESRLNTEVSLDKPELNAPKCDSRARTEVSLDELEWSTPKLQDSPQKTIAAAEANDRANVGVPAIKTEKSDPVVSLESVTPLISSTSLPSSAEDNALQEVDGSEKKRSNTQSSLLLKLEAAEEEAAEEKEHVKRDRLKDALQKTESLQESEDPSGSITTNVSHFYQDMTVQKEDTILDIVMAIIILLNSVVIGISMDHNDPAIDMIDLIFTICFLIELGCKFYLHGFIDHFSHGANVFDFFLVAVDIFQLVLEWMDIDLLSDAPAASMFRVARLVRLVRLIRLARLDMLDDLVALISGMVGGMTTLLWSIVLFFLILYITSLLFREFFGRSTYVMPYNDEDMTYYFASVPRCMLTVFRFFFGDFSTITGLNIFEGIQECYGALAAVLVCGFFFMITIGLFNVIAAIFVESTLAAANQAQIVRKTERMNDEILWATRLTLLVRKIFEYNGNTLPDKTSLVLDSVSDQAIPEAVFQEYMKDTSVVKALNDLEIDESDHKYLFDILDNDNTGSIYISQLSDGLERLRGDPRRSDIICVDLMVRSIQQQTDFLVEAAKANVKTTTGNRKKMDENQNSLRRIEASLQQLTSQGHFMACREDTYDI